MMREKLALAAPSTAVLALLMSLASAQEPSPAGGGYVEFDGEDSFLVLEAGKLVDTKFESITLEAWIYLRDVPEIQGRWIIAAKPGSFELSIPEGGANQLFGYSFKVYDKQNWCERTRGGREHELNRWHHVSGSFDASAHLNRLSLDGSVSTGGSWPGDLANTEASLYIGGTNELGKPCFDGFIDEVRISDIVRYKGRFQIPKGRLRADESTIALWHFDNGLMDSSGNGNTLVRKGKGVEFIAFPVEPIGKLSITWAGIKSGRNLLW